MDYRYEDQQQRQRLLTIVDRGSVEQLFTFLQGFHRRPFQKLADVMEYNGVIDDEISFIDCSGTKYNVTPLIIAAGKGSLEKTKILLVHGANPNKQCATGDTALNLAVHRQKYLVVDLLLQYHANPNVYNQAGKTALHRAVVSYTDDNANHIRSLLDAGADLTIEDQNRRIPLDEAVIANKPGIVDILLSHDRTLIEHSYRAAIIASRLGHDQCLEILLNYGLDPNITDRTSTTPLHVAVRSLKLSTVQLLLAKGADQYLANNRGETAVDIAEHLQPDQQQNFINLLTHAPPVAVSDFPSSKSGSALSYVYPLLRNHPNWTLDSDEFRSPTAQDSSIQNLLDTSSGTFWCCTQSKNAWIIFDLKHQYNITGVRLIGCENQSTPKNGHLDVSNALNGPWLKVKDFSCLLTQGNKNDFLFPSLTTRFIRVFILDNYGGKDIRIQSISFFGVDTRLIHLLQEYGLENSLNTLLANGINDQETLDENQDEILNSSDKYLHVNDHFQFIRLTESLKSPQLTFLEWFNPPQTTVIAGEKFHTFSVTADEGVTDRVKLEEKLENSPQATTALMRDLELIQGHSLVDFPDYTIKQPGRYQIRVVSVQSPNIHTPWQEIVVGSTLPYASIPNSVTDEHLYLSSTTHLPNETTGDKENTLLSQKTSTTTLTNKDNRGFITKVYESDNDDTEDESHLISLKSTENSPYYFPSIKTSHRTETMFVNYQPKKFYESEHYTQTKIIDCYDHSTNTDEGYGDSTNSLGHSNSTLRSDIHLTPSKYRSGSRAPLTNIFPDAHINNEKQSDEYETLEFGDKIIIPTKYRLQQERRNKLMNGENIDRAQQQSHYQPRHSQNQDELKQESSSRQQQSPYQQREQSRKRIESGEELVPQSHYHAREQSRQQNGSRREPSPEQEQAHYYELDESQKQNEPVRESPIRQQQSEYQQRHQSRKRTESDNEPLQQQPQYQRHEQLQNQNEWIQNLPSTPPQQEQSQYHQRQSSLPRNRSEKEASPLQQQQQSQYHQRQSSLPRNRSEKEASPLQQPLNYYGTGPSQKQSNSVRESPTRQQQSGYQQRHQSQKRPESDNEPLQQQSQYQRHGRLQNQNEWIQNSPSTPTQQQYSQYHQRQSSLPRNGSERGEASPPQKQQPTYYEIDPSQKQSDSARESPTRQQQSEYQQRHQSRKQMESDDASLQPQQQQQHGQLQNQNTWIQNPLSPPLSQRQQHSQQRNGLVSESSPERPQSNYHQLEQSQKRNESTREPPSRQRNDSEVETSPPQVKQQQQQQQSRKRNELEQDSSYTPPYYDEIPQPRVASNEKLPFQQLHQQQHQLTVGNIDHDHLKPLYNRYQIVSGDLELSENPSDNSLDTDISRPRQMQLVFKAILQGPKVQERAKNSLYELVAIRSPTHSTSNTDHQNNLNKISYPNSPQSSSHSNRRNQNTTNILAKQEREYQTESNHNSRSNSMSRIAQAPAPLMRPDHDKHSATVDYPSFQPLSHPDEPIQRRTFDDHSSRRESNRQSPLSHQLVPSNINTSHTKNDNDLEGIHVRSRSSSSSQNYKSSKYEKNPLKRTENSRSSPLLSSPKSKYFFGEHAQNQSSSDEESDEIECEAFGHDSQPRALINNNTRRNLDYPSVTSAPYSVKHHNNSDNLQFTQQSDIGTATSDSLTQQQRRSPTTNQSTVGKARDSPPDSPTFTSNKQIPPQVDYEASDAYPVLASYNDTNQKMSTPASSTTGFQQYHADSNHYEQNIGINTKQEQLTNQFNRNRNDDDQLEYEEDDHDRDNDNNNEYEEDDHDIHDQQDRHYINSVDDDDDNVPKEEENRHSPVPRQLGMDLILRQNPVRDIPTGFQPTQYPSSLPPALPQPNISLTTKPPKKGGKKPLEITVRTADQSHLYTPGIIPPKLPSTPTTDITDEITEREPFDKPHTFRPTPDSYRRDSRDDNEEDTDESGTMSEIRPHNRDRLAKFKAERKDYGTQSEEKSTRSIGTMCEPIKTRHFGHEAQPQSSATQTSSLLQQQHQLHETDLEQAASQRSQQDLRTNGYYSSQRSTSLDHRNKYVLPSPIPPRQKDNLDYDQYQTPHLSQYNDDPRGQYRTTRNDYQRPTTHRPHSSSHSRHYIPSSTSPHRTPPPPAEYRSTSSKNRYRTPSPSNHHRLTQPQRSRSPSPPNPQHTHTSTDRYRTVSPSSQRRSRPPQRSPSPPTSRPHISSTRNLHRSPSPPDPQHIHASTDRYRAVSPSSQRHSRPPQRSPSPPTSRPHISSTRNLHRSPSPPDPQHIHASTDRYRAVSPSSQRHSRPPQRSPSPPTSRPHISSTRNLHHSPSPPNPKHIHTSTDRYRTDSPSSQRRSRPPQRSPSPPTARPHIASTTNLSRSPSPPNPEHIQTSTDRYRTVSPSSQRRSPPTSQPHISSTTNVPRTPSPPAEYRSTSRNGRHRSPSSSSKNYSHKTKDRRQMASTETDTNLDRTQPQHHRDVQTDPPTRDYETTTNTEKKYPPETSYSTNPNTRSSYSQYETLNSSLPRRQDYTLTSPNETNYKSLRNDEPPSTRKSYRLRPVRNDSDTNDYEEIPFEHNESISPEDNRTFDRPKDYTPKPFTGDRRQQTSPTVEPRSDKEVHHATSNFIDDIPIEDYVRELPSGGSVSIPSTPVIQPHSLPRSYGQYNSPTHQKHDQLVNRRKIPKLPLHYGQLQRTPSARDSLLLNIGSENIIHQSPDNEFATPFSIRYVEEPADEFTTDNNNIRSSTLKRADLRSRNNRILLLPVLNSSRTYVFEKQSLPGQQIRQSRTNGNFYLAASPTLHSLNSSFQGDDLEIDPLTQNIDSDNLTGHALRSQVA